MPRTIGMNIVRCDKHTCICVFKNRWNGHGIRKCTVVRFAGRIYHTIEIYLTQNKCDTIQRLMLAIWTLIKLLQDNGWQINIMSKNRVLEQLGDHRMFGAQRHGILPGMSFMVMRIFNRLIVSVLSYLMFYMLRNINK